MFHSYLVIGPSEVCTVLNVNEAGTRLAREPASFRVSFTTALSSSHVLAPPPGSEVEPESIEDMGLARSSEAIHKL